MTESVQTSRATEHKAVPELHNGARWPLVAFLVGTGWSGDGYVGLGAAGIVYFVGVQMKPWTGCLICGERKRYRDKAGTSWGNCWWCQGSGSRLRLLAVKRWTGE